MVAQGSLLANYAHIFEIILRLRQVCDHPFLIYTRGDVATKNSMEKTLQKFIENRLNFLANQKKLENENSQHLEPIID